ncbi:MAG: peptidoglycan-binding protein [Clostridia bacterium]|nr:peptidoglycan-binding protein [Clostridia bacterium]
MKRLTWLLILGLLLTLCAGALAEETVYETPAPIEDDETIEEDSEARTLKVGDSGEDVREVQTHLAELGYFSGQVTGRYGEATAAAIKSFQADFGLKATGVCDAKTHALLFSTIYRPLKYGSSGQDVQRLQTRLSVLGYFTGKLSGNYLKATQQAVSDFQTKNGLTVTGDADVDTQNAIYSDYALARSASVSVTPEPEVIDIVDGNDPDAGEPTPVPTVKFTKTLKRGSSGALVKNVQNRLTELGYYNGPITGNYMDKTKAAVIAFQTQNGLTADGVLNDKSWNALFNDPNVVLPGDTPKPTNTPEPVPFYIVVDVTNQAVTVYGRDANGDYTVVVRQMMCSTGTTANPSPVGDWVLNGRKARWCKFPKWGDYAQYWTQINSDVAFHSVIYNTVSNMDLSVKSYKRLGSRASHGCIRLQVADAKWIYDNVPAGVTVTITEKLPKDPELKASLVKPALNYKNMLPVSTAQPTAEPIYVSGAKPPLPLTEIRKNDSSEAVYWLQKKLTELGYYHGKCSGTCLDGTLAAVKAFQKDHGMRQTNSVTVATLEAIYASELADPAGTAAPVPDQEPEVTPDGREDVPAPTPTRTVSRTPRPIRTATPAPILTPAPESN